MYGVHVGVVFELGSIVGRQSHLKSVTAFPLSPPLLSSFFIISPSSLLLSLLPLPLSLPLSLSLPPLQVVSALSSCRPIVTPAWLQEAIRCTSVSQPLPPPSAFLPEIADTSISAEGVKAASLFSPKYSRTVLFQDRVFYFLSEKQVQCVCSVQCWVLGVGCW